MWGFPPGETPGARKVGVSPGETGGARKTGVPRTKVITVYWKLLHKLGLSANSQEALSMVMNVLLNCNYK